MVQFKTRKISTSKTRSKNKWKDWRWWLRISLITGAASFLIGIIIVIGVFIYYGRDLPSDDELQSVEYADQSTKIYDRTGETVLFEVHGEEKRTLIPFEEIPQDLIDATLAVEDSEFYNHNGIHLKSLIRAFFANLGGGVNQGGSTITQQLIKNTLLTQERTISRKVKEAILAVKLEQKYSKEEILEFYINRIPYGNNAYGIQAAARTYFGKDAKDLTLAESSILAGLPNRPTYLNPYGDHRDDLYSRQEHILNRMKELGMIDEDEKEEAIELAQADNFFQDIDVHTTIKAPHFVFYIKDLLEEWANENDLPAHAMETNGYKVTTTLDYELYEKAKNIVGEYSAKNEDYNISNMAMLAIEPDTGYIISMVGSRDWANDEIEGKVNVTLRNRQPGSSFKPYVYATAFDKGYNPQTVLYDVKTDFGDDGSGSHYVPNNFDYANRGPVTMQDAMLKSLNIPAVKTFYLSGAKNVIKTARSMGLTSLDEEGTYGLSTALGTEEVKMIDHLAALSVFGNEGMKVDKIAILKIEDSEGNIVLDNTKEQKGERAIDKNVARMMNQALSARTSGTLFVPGYKVAAKTGTSTKIVDGKSRPSNTWTFGWTSKIAAGFWAGNNDGSALSSSAVSTRNAAPAWQAFMKEALAKYGKSNFNSPEIPSSDKPILNGDTTAGETVVICKFEGKLANDNTPATQTEEKIFGGTHTILYYVDKDDPLGPRPSNPYDDPQYENWEKGVLAWTKGISIDQITDISIDGAAPTEYCTVHDPENRPKVIIEEPADGADVEESSFSINIKATSPLTETYDEIKIKQIEFFIDGDQVGIVTEGSDNIYEYDLDISAYEGEIEIIVKVYDSIDNMTSESFMVNVISAPEEESEEEEEEPILP